MDDTPHDPEALKLLQQAIVEFVPHNHALGLAFHEVTQTTVTLRLPYDQKLVGNPLTGVLHGGAITTLLDATCGASVYLKLRAPLPIATLDLRVDFLGKPPARADVFVKAECYHLTRSVAFVRAPAWVDDEQKPFATAAATFALSTKGRAPAPETTP